MIAHRLHMLLPILMTLNLLSGCSSGQDEDAPKKTVISLFGAMEKDDQAALLYVLDMPELMTNLNEDYALQTDTPRVFTSPEQVLEDLTGDGLTKKTWFALQRIISSVNHTGEETATVDVTFVDKEKSKGYMTRFGLHKVNGKWKIYSFKTVSGS